MHSKSRPVCQICKPACTCGARLLSWHANVQTCLGQWQKCKRLYAAHVVAHRRMRARQCQRRRRAACLLAQGSAMKTLHGPVPSYPDYVLALQGVFQKPQERMSRSCCWSERLLSHELWRCSSSQLVGCSANAVRHKPARQPGAGPTRLDAYIMSRLSCSLIALQEWLLRTAGRTAAHRAPWRKSRLSTAGTATICTHAAA